MYIICKYCETHCTTYSYTYETHFVKTNDSNCNYIVLKTNVYTPVL